MPKSQYEGYEQTFYLHKNSVLYSLKKADKDALSEIDHYFQWVYTGFRRREGDKSGMDLKIKM